MEKLKTAKLGSVCKFLNGGTPSKDISEYFDGDIAWITGADITSFKVTKARSFITEKAIKESATNLVPPGTVLLVTRTSVGKVAIAGIPLCFSQDITAIKNDEKYLDTGFLSYFLQTKEPHFKQKARGATIGGITREIVSEIEIPLPKPDEQKRIAAILDKAYRLRHQRRFAQTLSDSFLQSVFIKMFGDIFKNEKGFDIGELGQKLSFLTSGSRGWAEHYTAKGALFLRIQNVNKGELLLDDIAFVEAPDTAEAKRTKVKEGDVLLTITAALGRSAVIPKNLPTAYINQHIALLRVKEINPTFVSHFITSNSGQIQIQMLDREGVKSGLNFDDIKGIKILFPPLPLQEKFADIVQKFERVRRQQREATRQAEHLFQTLLHRAFTGTL